MRVAAAIDQDQNRNSERKATLRRAASLPVSRRENPRLEYLRSRKQSSFLNVKDAPPSSLLTSVVDENEGHRSTRLTTAARGRKRGPSPRGTPQTDHMASTSASVVEPAADGEQRPRKRRKQSPVPPVIASSSQLSAPSQSRRRTRSRAGSLVTDVEYVPPSRVSARRARKTHHPFINYRSLDIYTHLADPDSAGHLLGEPSTSSPMLSTSKDTSRSHPVGKHRGRRKTINLGDEVTKRNLMEEWAQLRQSQGALPLSGIDQNACLSKPLCRDSQNGGESILSMQFQPTIGGSSPDPGLVESQATTVTDTSQSEETVLNVPINLSLAPMGLGDDSSAVSDALDHNGLAPPDGETDQPIIPDKGIEAPSIPLSDLRVDEDFPNDKPTSAPDLAYHHEVSQLPASSPPVPSILASQDGPVRLRHNEQAKGSSIHDALKDSHSVNVSQMSSLDNDTIHLDFEEQFYMFDIPEMFTLPWVPVSSHLYVPPGLGKLISGMREQLTMATRARQRAEEQYQAELNRRISAEKVIKELQTGLEEKQNEFAGKATCWASRRQRASSAPCQRNSNQ